MAHKRFSKNKAKRNVFSSPGTLQYVGREVLENSSVRLIEFDDQFERELNIIDIQNSLKIKDTKHIKWIEIDGSHDEAIIQKIGQNFGLHPLVQEDILNTLSKPKIEYFDKGQLFVVMKTINFNSENFELEIEQVGIILIDKTHLISFQEQNNNDIFQPIIDRIKASIGKTRKNNADYLLFSLMDLIIDNYFLTLEKITETLETIEDSIFTEPNEDHQTQLYTIKRVLANFRKNVFPLREMLSSLINEGSDGLDASSIVYFRDLQDHIIQILDGIESSREIADSLMNFHLSQLSNRMNSVMKTLTVFTAIFMPLGFVAGIYGMNFKHMPELEHQNGYFITLGIMLAIGVGLLGYFKWKKYV